MLTTLITVNCRKLDELEVRTILLKCYQYTNNSDHAHCIRCLKVANCVLVARLSIQFHSLSVHKFLPLPVALTFSGDMKTGEYLDGSSVVLHLFHQLHVLLASWNICWSTQQKVNSELADSRVGANYIWMYLHSHKPITITNTISYWYIRSITTAFSIAFWCNYLKLHILMKT